MSVLDAIKQQYENNKKGNTTSTTYEQDFSKYFNVRLEEGEDSGEMTIRLMPPKDGVHPVVKEGETPFDEGHWHVIKVGGKWRKIYCKKHNDGEECPLCNTVDELYTSWKETGNKEDKELANSYRARKFYLARVIDRSNEGDGVKFWRFPHNFKGEGIFDKLIPIFTKKGDISDPREGRDLTIILGRDNKGYTKVTSIMSEDPSVLTDPKSEEAKIWMKDETSWKEVYSAPPVEYVQLISEGETPVWDKNLEKFVAKGDDSEATVSIKEEPVKKVVTTTEGSDDDYEDEVPF